MIKHYDRFIGGHDSAAINHSATSNRGRRKRRRRRPIFNDDVAPATSSLLSSRNWRRKSGSIFGEIFGEKGRGGFSRCTWFVCRTGQVIAAGSGRDRKRGSNEAILGITMSESRVIEWATALHFIGHTVRAWIIIRHGRGWGSNYLVRGG